MSLIPESMAFAIPNRTKTLNVLETLVIGTAGGALFLWADLPGGLISGAMVAVGAAAHRRAAAQRAADPDPDRAGAAGGFRWAR